VFDAVVSLAGYGLGTEDPQHERFRAPQPQSGQIFRDFVERYGTRMAKVPVVLAVHAWCDSLSSYNDDCEIIWAVKQQARREGFTQHVADMITELGAWGEAPVAKFTDVSFSWKTFVNGLDLLARSTTWASQLSYAKCRGEIVRMQEGTLKGLFRIGVALTLQFVPKSMESPHGGFQIAGRRGANTSGPVGVGSESLAVDFQALSTPCVTASVAVHMAMQIGKHELLLRGFGNLQDITRLRGMRGWCRGIFKKTQSDPVIPRTGGRNLEAQEISKATVCRLTLYNTNQDTGTLSVFHVLSYHTCKTYNIPISDRGIYVAQSGFSFGLQIPVSAVITSVAGKRVTSLKAFETALAGIPNKEMFEVRWFNPSANEHRQKCSMIRMERTLWPARVWDFCPKRPNTWQRRSWDGEVADDKRGAAAATTEPVECSPVSDARSRASAEQDADVGPAALSGQEDSFGYPENSDAAISMVQPMLCTIVTQVSHEYATDFLQSKEENKSTVIRRCGVGLVIDSTAGLVLTDRYTVPQPLVEVELTFGQTVTVNATCLFMHPHHNMVLLHYAPTAVKDLPVRSIDLSDVAAGDATKTDELSAGQILSFVSIHSDHQLSAKQVTVGSMCLKVWPFPQPPAYRGRNLEICNLNDTLHGLGGLLIEPAPSYRIRAWFAQFPAGSLRYLAGVPVQVFAAVLASLGLPLQGSWAGKRGPAVDPTLAVAALECEFEEVSLAKARREDGVPLENARALAACSSGGRRHILRVGRITSGKQSSACASAFAVCARVHQESHLRADAASQGALLRACYASVIAACATAQRWEYCLSVLHEALGAGMLPTPAIFGATLGAVEEAAREKDSEELLRIMAARHVELNVIALSTAMSAAHRGGRWHRAVGFFRQLRVSSLRPDLPALTAAIGATAAGLLWKIAARHQLELGTTQLNSGLTALARGRQWQLSLCACSKEASSDGFSYNAAMAAADRGAWPVSLAYFAQVQAKKLPVGVITCSTGISSCSDAWVQASELLAILGTLREDPTQVTLNAAISALGKGPYIPSRPENVCHADLSASKA
ncbi:nma111, partial [Symbiodinium sp. CCMP2456]